MQKILITSQETDVDSAEYEYIFSVADLLADVSQDEVVTASWEVSSLSVPNTGCIEYSILWRKIAQPQTNDLIEAILFARRLERKLDELQITDGTLVCEDSVKDLYARVVEDVGKNAGLETERLDSGLVSTLTLLIQMLPILGKLAVEISDWFVTRIVTLGADPTETDIGYFPPIERLSSTLPIVEQFTSKPRTILVVPYLYYILQSDVKTKLDEYEPVVVNQYLSVAGFAGQIRDMGTIARELLTLGSFTPMVVNHIESEFGIRLEATIGLLMRNALTNFRLVRALVHQRSIRAALSRTGVRKVVIGSVDPIGRAIIHEATRQDLDVYHIPHSVGTMRPVNPRGNATTFPSGELDVRYYNDVVPDDHPWTVEPLGRPYLVELRNEYVKESDDRRTEAAADEPWKVLIATQPRPEDVQREFIGAIVESCDPDRFDITIKPHPGEDVEFYMKLKQEYEDINVITGDLYDTIVESDLTVTIRSNVGLESIIIGTPTVCFNADSWGPFSLEQTYALTDDVPVCGSRTEFQTFIDQLDSDGLSRLRDRQREFVKQNYYLDSDCAAKMAAYIESH